MIENAKITVEIRVNSLSDMSVIQAIERYLKNGYHIKNAKWDSASGCYIVVLAK